MKCKHQQFTSSNDVNKQLTPFLRFDMTSYVEVYRTYKIISMKNAPLKRVPKKKNWIRIENNSVLIRRMRYSTNGKEHGKSQYVYSTRHDNEDFSFLVIHLGRGNIESPEKHENTICHILSLPISLDREHFTEFVPSHTYVL